MVGGGCRERVDRMDVVKVCLAAKSKQKNVRKNLVERQKELIASL